MTGTCAFCGTTTSMTGEHVLGDWLSRIGLDLQPVAHVAGAHNRLAKPIGVTPPFRRTVRDVCGPCNHGWMSNLEKTAKRVLAPFILGNAGALDRDVLSGVAAWTHKTMLVAMLVSSEQERAAGHGLPVGEYQALYDQRERVEPLPASTFWIGRYDGEQRLASTWVTPLVVEIDGLSAEPTTPHAYVMTLVLGQLLLHGLRFTTPGMQVTAAPSVQLAQLWPPRGGIAWPGDTSIDDEGFATLASGQRFEVAEPHLRLSPWKPATGLPTSRLNGSVIELPLICGKHTANYPATLALEAVHGTRHAFLASCECQITYLIETASDGARCKSAGPIEDLARLYGERPGKEILLEDSNGPFMYKVL